MNIRRGRGQFNNFQILLNIGFSSTIVMGRLVEKLKLEKYSVTQWKTQAENFTTDLKVKLDFTLHSLITTNDVMWKCNVDDSANKRYDMILGRDILTELGLNLKFSEHVIEADDGT